MNETIFNSPDYKRSRTAYIAQNAFEYFASILIADAYLAKLLTHMGISDSMIGIISSLVSFSFLFQLLSISLSSHIRNTKRAVIVFDTIAQLFFLGMYLIPFLPFSVPIKTAIIISIVLFAYLCKYLISPLRFKWANSYVHPNHRGEFSAVNEMLSLAGGILFTIVMGYIFDHYENSGNIEGGFLFIISILLILNVCCFISMLLIKNESHKQTATQKKGLKEILQNTLGNRNFVNVIIMTALWEVGRYMTLGFLGTFKTNDLLLSVGTVQLINIIASLFRLVLSKPFGKLSDRTSFAHGYRVALTLAGIAFALNIFTTKSTWWLIILFTILYYISMAGIVQNNSNITYNYVRQEYLVPAMAIKSSICGVLGFLASLAGSRILQAVQDAGNTFLGIPMYGQQLLSGISVLFIIASILFTKLVIEKQKRLVQ